MKILLVEDCPEIAGITMGLLDQFEITHAEDGIVAIEILKKGSFDAIICDHHMPNATGEKVYRFLRFELEAQTLFIHHSSMSCPEKYVGHILDKNFHNITKCDFGTLLSVLNV